MIEAEVEAADGNQRSELFLVDSGSYAAFPSPSAAQFKAV
jgi:hypothetical protein